MSFETAIQVVGNIAFYSVKTLEVTGKALNASAAAMEAHSVYERVMDDTEKNPPTTAEKINAVTQGLYAVAQVTSLGVDLHGVIFSNGDTDAMKIAEVTAAGLNVAKSVTHLTTKEIEEITLGDILNVGSVAGQALKAYSHAYPNSLPISNEQANNLGMVLETAPIAYQIPSITIRLYQKWKMSENINPEGTHEVPSEVIAELEDFFSDEYAKEEVELSRDQEIQYLKLFIQKPLICKKIPKFLQENPMLMFTCAISGEKVRYAAVPANCADPETVYDRRALLNWSSPELPPRWPKDLPFDKKNFREGKIHQYTINRALLNMAKELSTIQELAD